MKEVSYCEKCFKMFDSDKLLDKHKKEPCTDTKKECQRDVVRTQWIEMIYKGSVQLNRNQMLLFGHDVNFPKEALDKITIDVQYFQKHMNQWGIKVSSSRRTRSKKFKEDFLNIFHSGTMKTEEGKRKAIKFFQEQTDYTEDNKSFLDIKNITQLCSSKASRIKKLAKETNSNKEIETIEDNDFIDDSMNHETIKENVSPNIKKKKLSDQRLTPSLKKQKLTSIQLKSLSDYGDLTHMFPVLLNESIIDNEQFQRLMTEIQMKHDTFKFIDSVNVERMFTFDKRQIMRLLSMTNTSDSFASDEILNQFISCY
jgi:hypothetical protein